MVTSCEVKRKAFGLDHDIPEPEKIFRLTACDPSANIAFFLSAFYHVNWLSLNLPNVSWKLS